MSNDFKSIHEFDFTLICNYFKALKRQGPGSPEVTQKAVSFINELSDKARIADIGCGTGGQTMALANYTKGQITGAVFCPLAMVDRAVFEQEGWHRDADGTVDG